MLDHEGFEIESFYDKECKNRTGSKSEYDSESES